MNLPPYQPDPASATRNLFFTGKGGVGETSLSCATVLKFAEAGKHVLLVSTDPASNLEEVLETPLTNSPSAIPGVPGLDAMNIDPVEAAGTAAYRDEVTANQGAAMDEALPIEPYAWIINQSLLHSGSCDPLLQGREQSERRYLQEVVETHAARTAWLPWQPDEPIGPEALVQLASSSLQTAPDLTT